MHFSEREFHHLKDCCHSIEAEYLTAWKKVKILVVGNEMPIQ